MFGEKKPVLLMTVKEVFNNFTAIKMSFHEKYHSDNLSCIVGLIFHI